MKTIALAYASLLCGIAVRSASMRSTPSMSFVWNRCWLRVAFLLGQYREFRIFIRDMPLWLKSNEEFWDRIQLDFRETDSMTTVQTWDACYRVTPEDLENLEQGIMQLHRSLGVASPEYLEEQKRINEKMGARIRERAGES